MTGLFKKSPSHLDYPTSTAYDGPLSDFHRKGDIQDEPLQQHVSPYSAGYYDALPPKIPEKRPSEVSEPEKSLGKLQKVFNGILNRHSPLLIDIG